MAASRSESRGKGRQNGRVRAAQWLPQEEIQVLALREGLTSSPKGDLGKRHKQILALPSVAEHGEDRLAEPATKEDFSWLQGREQKKSNPWRNKQVTIEAGSEKCPNKKKTLS